MCQSRIDACNIAIYALVDGNLFGKKLLDEKLTGQTVLDRNWNYEYLDYSDGLRVFKSERSRRKTSLLAVFAVLLGSLFGIPSSASATPAEIATEKATAVEGSRLVVFTSGHTDAITVVPNGPTISLVSKEDISHPGRATYHNPAHVIFGVKDAALTEQTVAIREIGVAGYALPQTQDANLLWPGWDSQALGEINAGKVSYSIVDIAGPGTVYLWKTANFGATQPILDSGRYQLGKGESFNQSAPAHTHANWLFTQSGTYTLTVVASAETPAGKLTSEAATYTFAVGNAEISRYQTQAGSDPENSKLTEATQAQTLAHPPSKSDDTAETGTKTSSGAEQCIPQEITVAGASSGRTAVGGAHTIPANTHVHPNWVFTAPGTYRVQITQSATSRSGQKVSATGVLTFNVGGAGNANNGHFDVGTGVSGGRLAMLIKDDRTQPAKWVQPNTLTFGVSGSAKTTAPAGIEFIASAGTPIWMISSTQVSGVPWVGANTQHPELLRSTTGAVTWRLDAVEGPGALAVFESGNFGKIVGVRWFGGRGGSQSGKSAQWVGRTASGEPCQLSAEQIREIEANGGVVAADSRLGSTGSTVLSVCIAAIVLLLAGSALLIHRRKMMHR